MGKWYERDPDEPGLTQYERRRRRYFKQLHLAKPKWANTKAVNAIYKKAALLGKETDHIVPICNPIVCGLHCEDNLQILTIAANQFKSNHIWPDSPYDNHDLFDYEEIEQYELSL